MPKMTDKEVDVIRERFGSFISGRSAVEDYTVLTEEEFTAHFDGHQDAHTDAHQDFVPPHN